MSSSSSTPKCWPYTGARYVQEQSFARAAYQSSAPTGFIHAVVASLKGLGDLRASEAKNKHRNQQGDNKLVIREVIESTHHEQYRNRHVHAPVKLEEASKQIGGIGESTTKGRIGQSEASKAVQEKVK